MLARSSPERLAGMLLVLDGKRVGAWRGSSMVRPFGVSKNRLHDIVALNQQFRGRHAFAQPAAARCSAPQHLLNVAGALFGQVHRTRRPGMGRSACRFDVPPRRRGAFLVFELACGCQIGRGTPAAPDFKNDTPAHCCAGAICQYYLTRPALQPLPPPRRRHPEGLPLACRPSRSAARPCCPRS